MGRSADTGGARGASGVREGRLPVLRRSSASTRRGRTLWVDETLRRMRRRNQAGPTIALAERPARCGVPGRQSLGYMAPGGCCRSASGRHRYSLDPGAGTMAGPPPTPGYWWRPPPARVQGSATYASCEHIPAPPADRVPPGRSLRVSSVATADVLCQVAGTAS
jgi:hypothetical protein